MTPRWIALAVGLATLLIVGVFVAAVLWPPPPPPQAPAAGSDAPAVRVTRVVSQVGSWTVTADVAPAGASNMAILVSIFDAEGRAADASMRPTAVLRMVDMAMGTEAVDLVPEAPGRWRGSGRLSMAGRWQVDLSVEGRRIMVPFTSLRWPRPPWS